MAVPSRLPFNGRARARAPLGLPLGHPTLSKPSLPACSRAQSRWGHHLGQCQALPYTFPACLALIAWGALSWVWWPTGDPQTADGISQQERSFSHPQRCQVRSCSDAAAAVSHCCRPFITIGATRLEPHCHCHPARAVQLAPSCWCTSWPGALGPSGWPLCAPLQ